MLRSLLGACVIATLMSGPAVAQSYASYAGYMGVPSFSTYPSAPCAQCRPHAYDDYAIPARPDDVKIGFRVLGDGGELIGAVVAADAASAVVQTASALVRVPKDAFGKSSNGLVLHLSRARLEKLARAAG